MRLTANYNTAQVKRTLLKGIEELEHVWDLKPRQPERRFRKEGTGRWIAVFERRAKQRRVPIETIASAVPILNQSMSIPIVTVNPQNLERELIKRGIGPASAEELTLSHPSSQIQEMIELYDWYNSKGQARGPGFLVQSIRNPSPIARPPGFVSSSAKQAAVQRQKAAKASDEQLRTRRERQAAEQDKTRQRAFTAFWDALSPSDQDTFETEALDQAEHLTRRLYLQHSAKRDKAFELYRKVILQSHFLKSHQLAGGE